MTSSYQKISGFDRPHVSEMLSDSKISTLESRFKSSGFACEFAVCVWTIAVSGKKKLRIQKYPVTCGWGLKCSLLARQICQMLVLARINTLLACSQMLAKTILYPLYWFQSSFSAQQVQTSSHVDVLFLISWFSEFSFSC